MENSLEALFMEMKVKVEHLRKTEVNVWRDSKYEWFKTQMPGAKGSQAEKIVREWFESKGYKCEKAISKDHDIIIDGRKKEIKCSCLDKKGDIHTFFQIRQDQDYDDLLLIFVKPDGITMIEINGKDLIKYIKEHPKEGGWAGGKKKINKLKEQFQDEWVNEYDLFQWIFNVKKSSLPEHKKFEL